MNRAGLVDLTVYDVRGHAVRNLWHAAVERGGAHRIEWDGRDSSNRTVSRGHYFARLRLSGRLVATRTMTFIGAAGSP